MRFLILFISLVNAFSCIFLFFNQQDRMDMDKFIRILNLTRSSSDNEALNAVRMVNRMLELNELTWSELLVHEKPKRINTAYSEETERRIKEMFIFINEHKYLWPDFDPDLVDSLKADFYDGKIMTTRQLDALIKIHHRFINLKRKTTN